MYKLNLVFVFIIFLTVSSCNEKDKSEKTVEETKEKTEEKVPVVIDSTSFKLKDNDYKVPSVVEDVVPSSKAEVEKLVDSEDLSKLNKYQKKVQSFINTCAKQNYTKAASFLAYLGKDKSRRHKDVFNPANAQELNIVKSTVDVVFTFLAESSDYEFISYKEKNDVNIGAIHEVEITFFKKGMGINRRFFELIESPKGLIIYKMR